MTHNNARFWVFVNGGAVKLTLRPGQSLEWSEAHTTDEGWSSEWHRWEFDGHEVTETCNCCSLDCDGRLDRYYESRCRADKLMRVVPHPDYSDLADVLWPEWESCNSSQRDYAAEAAGY